MTKSISIPLIGGGEVTLFLNSTSKIALVKDDKRGNGRCVLIDDLQNNGGWQLDQPYDVVTRRLDVLFASLPR